MPLIERMVYGRGHKDLSPVLVYHPNLPQAQSSTQVLDSLDSQHIFHVKRKACESFWAAAEHTKCGVSSISIWKIVTSHKLLRNKAIFIEKKSLQWKTSFKTRRMFFKLAHVLCMRCVLHFLSLEVSNFWFYHFKIWRYILGILFTNWKPCREFWSGGRNIQFIMEKW